MGIESLLFISLAITFVMLIMLVYHFQNKFDSVEKRTSTLLEIINNMVKELKEVKTHIARQQELSKKVSLEPLEKMQIDLGNSIVNKEIEDSDEEDSDEEDSDGEDSDGEDSDGEDQIKNVENIVDDKIVVSDTEEDIAEIVVHKLNNESNYRKLDLRQLRQLALKRGLIDEAQQKKIRKNEVIDILEKQ